MRKTIGLLTVAFGLLCCTANGARVKAREIPKGAAIENKHLVVSAVPGTDGVTVETKNENPTKVTLVLVGADGAAAAIGEAKVGKLEGNEGVLHVTAGSAEADITLGAGRVFVTAAPGKNASAIKVRASMKYAMLPDFFANDVIYDPRRFTSAQVSVPAENFLLGFVEGERAMVMCVWQGALSLGKKDGTEGKNPEVSLRFTGEGGSRTVEAGRIHFPGKPVHVAVLQHEKMWHEVDVSGWKEAQKVHGIEWKRPFDAKWRGDTMAREGKRSGDFFTRTISNTFLYGGEAGAKWKSEGGVPYHPSICQQGLWPYYIYQAWFHKADTYLCMYADRAVRQGIRGHQQKQKKLEQQAKKEGKEFIPEPYVMENIYERVLIYPLDRREKTPVEVFTPVDIMRATLGQGPCEYILDLEGLKKRFHGGKEKMHFETATCGVRDQVINPIMSKDVRKLKDGEKLDEKKKQDLLHGMKDMLLFTQGVYSRVKEYDAYSRELAKVLEEGKGTEKLEQVAALIEPTAKAFRNALDRFFERAEKDLASWSTKMPELIKQVEADQYKAAGESTGITRFAEYQDVVMAQCRRFTRGMMTEVSLADVKDAGAAAYAAKIRKMSHDAMRNRHPMEWYAFD